MAAYIAVVVVVNRRINVTAATTSDDDKSRGYCHFGLGLEMWQIDQIWVSCKSVWDVRFSQTVIK
jgi:hypothetical protein